MQGGTSYLIKIHKDPVSMVTSTFPAASFCVVSIGIVSLKVFTVGLALRKCTFPAFFHYNKKAMYQILLIHFLNPNVSTALLLRYIPTNVLLTPGQYIKDIRIRPRQFLLSEPQVSSFCGIPTLIHCASIVLNYINNYSEPNSKVNRKSPFF